MLLIRRHGYAHCLPRLALRDSLAVNACASSARSLWCGPCPWGRPGHLQPWATPSAPLRSRCQGAVLVTEGCLRALVASAFLPIAADLLPWVSPLALRQRAAHLGCCLLLCGFRATSAGGGGPGFLRSIPATPLTGAFHRGDHSPTCRGLELALSLSKPLNQPVNRWAVALLGIEHGRNRGISQRPSWLHRQAIGSKAASRAIHPVGP